MVDEKVWSEIAHGSHDDQVHHEVPKEEVDNECGEGIVRALPAKRVACEGNGEEFVRG